MSRRKTTEEFIEQAKKVHGDKYDYSKVEYKTKEDKVLIICPKHGVFLQRANAHLNGCGCKKCSYEERGLIFRKTKDVFVKDATLKHNNFYSYENFIYTTSHEPSMITCPIHGDFLQSPNDHLNGKGCPLCKKSHLENEVLLFLNKNEIEFEYQKKFDWLGKQSLDFYIQKYNIAIECQGKQHFGFGGWNEDFDFEKQIERDSIKNELCNKNNIKLLYYTNEDVEYGGLYNELNLFKSIKSLFKSVGFEEKSFNDDLQNYFNKLNENDKIEIYGYELEKSNELYLSNNFMIKKTKEYVNNGKRFIHIFEDEWIHKNEIVKSIIKHILNKTENKIYARKCEIREVSSIESKNFLDKNHLQGNSCAKYRYGLYYNDELVSLMTFGSLRKNLGSSSKEGCYELLRFCNKLNTNVIGGASKLFKHFIKEHNPSEIISYCDYRWSDGRMYEMLGFELSHISQPNYYYIIDGKRKNRFGFRKDILIKEGFDGNKTEHQIMLERGIYRIYDCGCKVYKLNFK